VPPQGPAHLVRTPAEPTSPSEGLSEFRGSVDPSGTLTAHWHQSYRGDPEVPLRLVLRVIPHDLWTEDLEKKLRQAAETRGESVQASGIRNSDPGSTREPFTIDADFTSSRLVDFTARSPTLRLPFDSYQGSEAADLKLAEDGSLRIGGPFTMRWRATIELPPG